MPMHKKCSYQCEVAAKYNVSKTNAQYGRLESSVTVGFYLMYIVCQPSVHDCETKSNVSQ